MSAAEVGDPTLRCAWLGTVAYTRAWEAQRRLAAARRAGIVGDCLLLLEHPPVYTMGRNGDPAHIHGGPDRLRALGAEYHEVDRGGSVTFHGPGQLVAYPIVDLAAIFPIAGHPRLGDVIRYLRALEAAVCATCRELEVSAAPRPPYTGAWVGRDKLAAIGVKLARQITLHGLALNVCTDLRWFDAVVPCGISDAGVTSLAQQGVAGMTPERLAPRLAAHLAAALGRRLDAAVDLAALAGLEQADQAA